MISFLFFLSKNWRIFPLTENRDFSATRDRVNLFQKLRVLTIKLIKYVKNCWILLHQKNPKTMMMLWKISIIFVHTYINKQLISWHFLYYLRKFRNMLNSFNYENHENITASKFNRWTTMKKTLIFLVEKLSWITVHLTFDYNVVFVACGFIQDPRSAAIKIV